MLKLVFYRKFIHYFEMVLIEEEKSIRHFSLGKGRVITLHNTDCLVGMDFYPDKHFDVVVTSPPYNLGVSYDLYDDTVSREAYLEWLENVAIKIKQKLKDGGSFFLNIGSSLRNPWLPFEVALTLRSYFSLQNVIEWIKSIYIENESYGRKVTLNVGHYKPINSRRFLNHNHESIFHFTKNGDVSLDRLAIGVPYKDNGNINRWKNGSKGVRCRGNCWYVPYKTIRSRDKERPHPATFPVEIAEKCILLHGIKDETTVLDPFMGIGHTSLACVKLNVNCVGFEIDRGYFDTNVQILSEKASSFYPV
jgi:site-specific DNA-methyltransferase (adenine-specific)